MNDGEAATTYQLCSTPCACRPLTGEVLNTSSQ
jgi:hypothetical protein